MSRSHLTLVTVLLALTFLSWPASASEDYVVYIMPTHTLPDTAFPSTVVLPTSSIAGSRLLTDARALVIDIETLVSVDRRLEPALKQVFRDALREGKQVWVIGASVPENFLPDYLELPVRIQTFETTGRSKLLAAGVWVEEEGFSTKSIVSDALLSREELLGKILDNTH